MNPYLRNGDTPLDYLDLGKYLLRRIFWILLFGLICGGVTWAIQSHRLKNTNAGAEVDSESVAQTETEVRFDMESYEQKTEMIGISNEETRELLRKQKEYLQTAPYMQLDPNHVWRAKVVVWLESTSQQHPAYQIEELYRNDLGSVDYLQDLAKKRGIEARYLRELTGTWLISAADSSDSSSGDVVLHEDNKDDWVSSELFAIQALGNTEEEAQALLDVLLEELQVLNKKYAKECPHEIKVLSRTCTEAYDAGIRNAQRDQVAYTQSLMNLWLDFEAKSAQVVTPEGAAAAAALAAAESEAMEPVVKSEPIKPDKAGIIGFVVGILLMSLWFVLRYIRNDNLVDHKDMVRNGILLKDLGVASGQDVSMAVANIRIFAGEKKKLFLTGMASQDVFGQVCERLQKVLPEYGIVYARDVIHDPESREALISCDGAVLVEQKKVTHYSDMKEEVTFLYHADKEIVGAIIL